jgi:hypothetical protein
MRIIKTGITIIRMYFRQKYTVLQIYVEMV